MNRRGFVFVAVLLSAAVCWHLQPISTHDAAGGFLDPCSLRASSAGGCYLVCPRGDGPRLDALLDYSVVPAVPVDATIFVQVKNLIGQPIPGVPASDVWLIGCTDNLSLCGGSGAISADSATNDDGRTTISGSLAASGCDLAGVAVVVLGVIVADPNNCYDRLCLELVAKSVDLPGAVDGTVDLLDLSYFAFGYTSPPKSYTECIDFTCDGVVDLLDFTLFGFHYLHWC